MIVVGEGGNLAHQVCKHHVRGNAAELRILKKTQKIAVYTVHHNSINCFVDR